MRPAEIRLVPPPLADTFETPAMGIAAAVLVHVCRVNGDVWRPVTPREIQTVLGEEAAIGNEPWSAIVAGRLPAPDFAALVTAGYAERLPAPPDHELPFAFTAAGLLHLRTGPYHPAPRFCPTCGRTSPCVQWPKTPTEAEAEAIRFGRVGRDVTDYPPVVVAGHELRVLYECEKHGLFFVPSGAPPVFVTDTMYVPQPDGARLFPLPKPTP